MGIKVFLFPLGLTFLILGLAVLGYGIAQYLKSRKVLAEKRLVE